VGVTKTVPAERIAEAIALGLVDLGESRVQEAEPKLDAIASRVAGHELPRPVWHFVGHVQTNKARRVAARFDCVQSVDSPRLAETLERHAQDLGRQLRVLIEVNVAGEHQKAGVAPSDVPALVDAVAALSRLELAGLMTVGPRVDRPEDARPAFRTLAGIAERERSRRPEVALVELSMGMSGDFEMAIEEGATMVRVGSALFGART
jgi:pyridoxal phosphate enzyme (YggS family)